jgi:hypothetical protein
MTELRSEIETLIRIVTSRAKRDDTPFPEVIDAAKAVAGLYSVLLKDKTSLEPQSEAGTMGALQSMIEDANGKPAVPSRRGNGRPPKAS